MSLEDFAAEALDWPAVRDLLRRHAPSSLGREALDCLAPLSDADAAAALGRLREVCLALDRGAGPPLQGCPNPLAALADAGRYSRSLAGEDLDAVARFLRVAHEAATWLASRSESMPICAEALKNRPDTTALRADLERSISDKGEVRDDASPALRKLRAGISKLSREVERRVRAIANRADLRAAFAEGSAGQVHRRGGRSVLAVRAKSRGRVAGIVHDTSQTGETVFVEPADVVESGNRLATQRADEKREVQRGLRLAVVEVGIQELLDERDALVEHRAREV